MSSTPLFFKDKPIFGMDIGTGSVKVMQVNTDGKNKRSVTGYGTAQFDVNSMQDGEILNPEIVAKATLNLFKNHLIGDISSHRVALSVPAFRTYTRELQLPLMSKKELRDAITAEAEQYIPRPIDELYLDYTITGKTDTGISVYVVAVPQKIIDSYHLLTQMLGLEAVFIEPSIVSATRLLSVDTHNEIPTVLVDFGTQSADISILDSHVIVTGTVQAGGDLFTENIMKALDITEQEAILIKTKYGIGLSKKQEQIKEAVDPLLKQTIREIKRMIRYYEERSGDEKSKIEQVISMGGGANMPGLTDYLTENLRLPARMFDPWQVLDYGNLQPPSYAERSIYITVAGLAMVEAKGVLV